MKTFINSCSTSYRNLVISNKKKQLLKMYEKGQYAEIPKIFKGQKDYLSVTFDDFPFLYFMISEGNKTAVTAFIKDITFKDYLLFDQNNPLKCNSLVYAYFENQIEIAQILQQEGFSLGVANSEGQNILHMAAIYRRKEAFFQGLKKKLNHDLADIYGNTPLHYCCRTGQTQLIEPLLAGKAQKTSNLLHLFPIHMAIESMKPLAVELLKQDLWAKYPMFHPIHSAARVGACEIMRVLLKREATLINALDHKKLTPLHHAVSTQNLQSVSFLLEQSGILLNIRDEQGNTPLHIAFMRDDLQLAKRLVNAKADLDIQNNDYLAPVDLGLDSSSTEIRKYLRSLIGKSKRLSEWGARM